MNNLYTLCVAEGSGLCDDTQWTNQSACEDAGDCDDDDFDNDPDGCIGTCSLGSITDEDTCLNDAGTCLGNEDLNNLYDQCIGEGE